MLTAIVILNVSESVFFMLSPTKTTSLCKADNYHYSIVYYLCGFSSPQLLTLSQLFKHSKRLLIKRSSKLKDYEKERINAI